MTKREEQDFFVEKTVSPVVPFLLLFCSDAWIVASYSHLLAFLERSNRFLSPLCCKRHLKQNRVDGFFIFSCTLRSKKKKSRSFFFFLCSLTLSISSLLPSFFFDSVNSGFLFLRLVSMTTGGGKARFYTAIYTWGEKEEEEKKKVNSSQQRIRHHR